MSGYILIYGIFSGSFLDNLETLVAEKMIFLQMANTIFQIAK